MKNSLPLLSIGGMIVVIGFTIPAAGQSPTLAEPVLAGPVISGSIISGPVISGAVQADPVINHSTPISILGDGSFADTVAMMSDTITSDQSDSSLTSPIAARERVQERYPDGKPHIERWVQLDDSGNFVNHGSWKEFDREGNIVKSGEYENGRRHGEWFQIVSDSAANSLSTNLKGFQAPFRSMAMFNEGQLHGQWVITDHRNKMVFSWEFTNGKRDGVSLWFSPAGHKLMQVQYESNQPSGSMFQWNGTDKNPPKEIALVRGMELKTETNWFEKTKKRKKEEVSFLIPSPMHAAEHEWDRSLVRYAKADETKPLRHGDYKLWHANGTLAHTNTYNLGEPSGAAQWWYANGQVQVFGQYASGQPSGQWTWWHENGMRKSSGHYQDGSQVGLWRTWTPRGELAASEQKPSLDTATYYAEGNENDLLNDTLKGGDNEQQATRDSERGVNVIR